MHNEFEAQALMSNKTLSLVDLPPDRRDTGWKRVFRIKENLDGSLNCLKASYWQKGLIKLSVLIFMRRSV